ncbi:ATP-binding protein [uncultured Dialister sp.]|uniref:ATP-binding protein n=1 Tax=uncultured Dialister sp. TaxID=278064 RepID=UPI0025D31520|nr:ATP-binding protein [uncultured Dialister sp.]
MEIARNHYLQELLDRRENGSIKVITGLRRAGKSYLLFHIFYQYLLSEGIPEDHILRIPLDDDDYEELRERHVLSAFIKSKITDGNMYYLLLDEVQFCENFESVLNGLSRKENLDIYVTGSNSRFLSSDILTEFRGRGDEVRIYPLTFAEFTAAFEGTKEEAWRQYLTYGGLPQILSRKTAAQKASFLSNLFNSTYIKDVVDRNRLRGNEILSGLVNILASSVGSLTNPSKLANTFSSNGMEVTDKTISSYLSLLEDAFIIDKANRFDVKGKRYIHTPSKYYFTDVGLRNARLNFRQYEPNHLMENIIYNELLFRGYNVDVGVVEKYSRKDGRQTVKTLEIDFVCNQGSCRYYIQSAFSLPDQGKMMQETSSLDQLSDSFKKIIVTGDNMEPWHNDKGYLFINILDFLLDANSLEK